MSSVDTIRAIVDKLNANLGRGGAGQPAALELLIGEEHLGEHGRPPRIVWVPTDETYVAAQRARDVGSVVTEWDVKVWGPLEPPSPPDRLQDLAGTETLRDALLRAVHLVLGGRRGEGQLFELRGGRWETAGAREQLGMAVFVRIGLAAPVAGVEPMTLKPESITANPALGATQQAPIVLTEEGP